MVILFRHSVCIVREKRVSIAAAVHIDRLRAVCHIPLADIDLPVGVSQRAVVLGSRACCPVGSHENHRGLCAVSTQFGARLRASRSSVQRSCWTQGGSAIGVHLQLHGRRVLILQQALLDVFDAALPAILEAHPEGAEPDVLGRHASAEVCGEEREIERKSEREK